MIRPRVSPLVVLLCALAPRIASADGSPSAVDRIITIISSVVVPILLALVGHWLGAARTRKEEEKVRAKSVYLPPPQPKTVLNWLAEVGNVAAPTSQLIAPSSGRRAWMPIAVTGALIGIGVITGVLVARLVASKDPAPVAAPAAAAVPGVSFKMFLDRGDHFVRAGTAEGLAVGTAIKVLDAGGAVTGQGLVVEVWEHVARVSVDPVPAAGAVLHASFVPNAPVAAAVPKPTPPAVKAPKPVTGTAVAAPALAAAAGLRGVVSIGGFGPAKRLTITNTGTTNWTRCELRLPTNKRYLLDSLAAGAVDGVMLIKFAQDGVEHDAELTWVNVTCAEGTARINVH